MKVKCHDKLNKWRREAKKVTRLFVLTARWLGLVADRVRAGMRFCLVLADGDKFRVTKNCRDDDAKTMPTGLALPKRLREGAAGRHDNSAMASSPIDFVTAAGLVTVPKV